MVTALSDMFRLSLTKSHSSYIQVAQEMEYVRSYLVLQQFRYQDCLNVSITIPDTVAELYIHGLPCSRWWKMLSNTA